MHRHALVMPLGRIAPVGHLRHLVQYLSVAAVGGQPAAADVTLSDDVLAAIDQVSREIRYPMG